MSSSLISVVLAGSESLLVQCGEHLLTRGHAIRAVLTSDARIRGWAAERAIPVIEPKGDYAPQVAALPAFDWLFSITHLALIPGAVLALPGKGSINFHDGPLPRYGGLNAATWAVLDRQAEHGITWHQMTARADAGDVLLQVPIPMAPDETSLTLNTRCWEAGVASFPELLSAVVEGRLQPRPHALDRATYHRRWDRPAAAGLLRWSRPAAELEALVRAMDFGAYRNPMATPHFPVGDDLVTVLRAAVVPGAHGAAPGTVLEIGDERLVVACGEDALALLATGTPAGEALAPARVAIRGAVRVGDVLPVLDAAREARLDARARELAPHEPFWTRRLAALQVPTLPLAGRPGPTPVARRMRAMPVPPEAVASWDARGEPGGMGDCLLTAFGAFVARLAGTRTATLAFRDTALAKTLEGDEPWFASWVPVQASHEAEDGFFHAFARMKEELEGVRHHRSHARTLAAREPSLRGAVPALTIGFEQVEHGEDHREEPGQHLTLVLPDDRVELAWWYRPDVLDDAAVEALQAQFAAFLCEIAHDWRRPLAAHALMDDATRTRLVEASNRTARDFDRSLCVHDLVSHRVAMQPEATAVICEDRQVTYGELDRQVTRVARVLRELGVGPDVLVGVAMRRSIEMVVAILAVHRAGGAYVPLDPAYPADRLALMLGDSQAPVLLTQTVLLEQLPATTAAVVCVDALLAGPDDATASAPLARAVTTPAHLAYVIYTSGSTGTPKGVMVEHRSVVNFFAGMDDRLGTEPGVWLAVTSLSFDISVLELLWTLTRGYTVVVHTDTPRAAAAAAQDAPGGEPAGARPRSVATAASRSARGMDFSLFYFSADAAANEGRDKYRLLLEGARFADERGFVAVWTPERHFHAFGGLYPNPAVTGAAVAAITTRVGVRAGSCVLPLHHPLRVAEEWSVVDNLSNGRVGIAFAAGWQPNDFILRPEGYGRSKDALAKDIDTVRRLWRGEALAHTSPTGQEVMLTTLPRPVQAELPFWLTTAGNPESFAMAGRIGARILTHLLGQSVEELAVKLAAYREAWRAAGHEGEGQVALMLHTYVGDDDAAVKATVRAPMREYLRTSIGLVKQYASTFPAFKRRADGTMPEMDFDALSADEMDALLEYSFERYYETSGLFGTPATCGRTIDALKAIGVDEIACLVDFGLDVDTTLAGLEPLDRLRAAHAQAAAPDEGDWSIPANLVRHRVTHLQCTPSMASMLVADERARGALRGLRTIMIGGEAFPGALADRLRTLSGATLVNMYGPTETTIWSSTHVVGPADRPVPLGAPIANTQLYVVDAAMRLTPPGVPGELLIAGEGVVRGYLRRPELTAERFVPNPFVAGGRAYRTGDLVRRRMNGTLEFLGRIDHQVKVRGYRIELGEIEATLARHATVREAVVVAREDVPGDTRLVAYVLARPGQAIDAAALRAHCRALMPDYMVPSHVVALEAFPQTPNRKVDRNALPAPEQVAAPTAASAAAPPHTEVERVIAGIWAEALKLPGVGIEDNFFDLGGHSLLAVQVHGRLRSVTGRELAITDLFRFPTVRALAAHLSRGDDAPVAGAAAVASRERGDARRQMLLARRQPRRPGT